MKHLRNYVCLAAVTGIFLLPGVSAIAQTASTSTAAATATDDSALATQCAQLSSSGCPAGTDSGVCKTELQQCSDYYDQQSAILGQDINETTAQKNTLANHISALKEQIQNLQAQINSGNIKVQGLNIQITATQNSITQTTQQISSSQQQIAAMLQTIAVEDQKPLFQILLTGSLADFFGNLTSLENVNSQLSSLLESNKDLQTYLTEQKGKMDSESDDLQKTIALQKEQQQQSNQTQQQQEQDLQLTESQYQQQVAQQQAVQTASAKIKALLFQVAGGDTTVPTFGQALTVAESVGQQVGVAPAFLLAIISQESAIGQNTGQCLLVDPTTGSGKNKNTGTTVIHIMAPNRDVPIFMTITAALGKDPYNTPVSCWIPAYVNGNPSGWGGAMGPAQFIPSTWNIFAGQLATLLGHPANPWSVQDSFTAAGLYLSQLGASAQTTASENTAAARYYGAAGAYNRQVMNRTACIQSFIDSSSMSASCQSLIF